MRKGRKALNTFVSALACIIIGLGIGFLILFFLSLSSLNKAGNPYTFMDVLKQAYDKGFRQILMGGFYLKQKGVGRELVIAAPLIMTGLSVAFAFKTGLFNIGAAGQYTVGAFGGLFFAIVLKMPWYVCLLAATLFGAAFGALPGIFKAYLNINEVITSIMFNWIGLYGVNTIVYGGGTGTMYNVKAAKSWALSGVNESALIPNFGMAKFFRNTPVTIGIFFAILVAIIMYIIINKTVFGYELKACGLNREAAKYAGINGKRNIVLSMAISGALAGFGAGIYYLSGAAEWEPLVSTALPTFGFDGISVALLAASNPLGVIFSALFISHIATGGNFMSANIFPPEIADIISGIIIYLCAFMMLFQNKIAHWMSRKNKYKKEGNKNVTAD